MIFQSPAQIAFEIFSLPVYYYGIVLAVSAFVGVYVSYIFYRKFYDAENAEKILEIAPFVVISGVLGARLYYCALSAEYYFTNPLQILNIREGGLSIHGMIIIGIISLCFLARYKKLAFLKLLDVFACGTALAQSIGRWGNFFNSEAYGTPTNLPWKLFIAPEYRVAEFAEFQFYHPTFLYESVFNFIIFLILFFLFKKVSKTPGVIASIYLILYSIARIFVEQIRIDSVLDFMGIPIPQIASALTIILAVIFIIVLKRRYQEV